MKDGSIMFNSFQTSNGVSYLARQTTDMAPITVDTTVVPTAMSNIMRSDIVFIDNLKINTQLGNPVIPVDQMIQRWDVFSRAK